MPNITKPAGMSQIWATAGTKTAPNSTKISQGWVVELPPYQTANYIENKQDQFNAHVNMHGMPLWDNETEYQGGVSYAKGSNGVIYKCKSTHTNLDPTNPLNASHWDIAFEAYGSVAALQAIVDQHLTNYATLAGLGNIATARTNLAVFSKTESDARFASIVGNAAQTFSVATATAGSHAVRLDQVATLLTPATQVNTGTLRFATTQEVEGGALDNVAVSPKTGADVYLKKSGNLAGLTNLSQARSNLGITDTAIQPVGTYVTNASVVGQTATFAGTTAPAGWLVCNGAAVSRTTYAALFAYIGTLYGAGNGSTTFNLPDCRNEFMRGWTGNTGSVGTKFADAIRSHAHTASSAGAGGHAHTGSAAAAGEHSHSAGTYAAGSHTHYVTDSVWTPNTGPDTIGNDNEPRKLRNFGSGDTYGNYLTSSAGDHAHGVVVYNGGNHAHTVSIDAVGDHAHAITVNATGAEETRPRGIYQLVCIRY